MQRKIVTDSSADILALADVPFACAPLKIRTAQQEYVDDVTLDVKQMVYDLRQYKGRSSTSCPNANDWLEAFGDADEVFCITITGTLSGSYNAAQTARQLYETAHPDRRVFVLNSLSTGPEMALAIDKIRSLILQDVPFEALCEQVIQYTAHTGLLFVLQSMNNLANNGRVSPFAAKAAGLLGIRVVGTASEHGDLQQLAKCRGETKALNAVVAYLAEYGLKTGRVNITHCFNEEAARSLENRIRDAFPQSQVQVAPCRGLCSFYAELGGLLIGFEKM